MHYSKVQRSIVFLQAAGLFPAFSACPDECAPVPFDISLDTVVEHDDGKFLWFHPRIAVIPQAGKEGNPAVFMTLQKHLQVSDFYSGLLLHAH